MQIITTAILFTDLIPLPAVASGETLTLTIRTASGGTLTGGTFAYLAGIQWKLTFTPATANEVYAVEVTDADSTVVFSNSYLAVGYAVSSSVVTSAASQLVIINNALTLIGAETITSIADGTRNADIMSTLYATSLKSVLSECLWNFATKRAALVTAASTVVNWYYDEEAYVYDRPTDVIRIFGVSDPVAIWREEGAYIISDTAGLGVRYVYYHNSPELYPASFIAALVDKLASDAAYIIVNSASKAQEMYEKYQKISLPNALSENSQIGAQQYMRDDAWELAKYNNSNPNA